MKTKFTAKGDGLKRLQKLGEALSKRPHVKVGVLGKSAPRSDDKLDNVKLAIIHEFGAPEAKIPSRSFVRRTYLDKKDPWQKLLERILKKVIAGKIDIPRALAILGFQAAGDMQRTIRKSVGMKALKPATLKAKFPKTKPLIDSGRLINSISFEVKA